MRKGLEVLIFISEFRSTSPFSFLDSPSLKSHFWSPSTPPLPPIPPAPPYPIKNEQCPMRAKTKTNRDTCDCFKFWLVHSVVCVRCGSLYMSLPVVFQLQMSWEVNQYHENQMQMGRNDKDKTISKMDNPAEKTSVKCYKLKLGQTQTQTRAKITISPDGSPTNIT